jgi:dTDP-4-dehydrorhamnose reductase
MIIGVTGANGRVGTQLVKEGCVPLGCDVTNRDDIQRELDRKHPDVIIHCAGKPQEWCERNSAEATRIIARGTYNVRDLFTGRIVFLSSMYVFSGETVGNYQENSNPAPKQVYGIAKLAAEAMCQSYTDRKTVIVRPSVLYGDLQRPSFVERVIKEFETSDMVSLASNIYRNYTYLPTFCKTLINLAEMKDPPSLIHFGDIDITSQVEFGECLVDIFGFDKSKIKPYQNTDPLVPKNLGIVLTKSSMKLFKYTLFDSLLMLKFEMDKIK